MHSVTYVGFQKNRGWLAGGVFEVPDNIVISGFKNLPAPEHQPPCIDDRNTRNSKKEKAQIFADEACRRSLQNPCRQIKAPERS